MSRPPSREGVGASSTVLPAGPWETLGAYLAERFPSVPKDEWLRRMQSGEVVDARGAPLGPDQAYLPNTRIFYYRSLSAEERIPFDEVILHHDDELVVVDKPHFLPVTPAGRYVQETLLVRLKRRLGIETLSPVHRIDRETAGIVLFTIRPGSRDLYQRLFRQRAVEKTYEAIAPAPAGLALPMTYRSRVVESDSFMRMQEIPGEPNAETLIEILESRGSLARYRLTPVTGQKHQLRVHMAALGMPILHDSIYPVHFPEKSPDGRYLTPDYSLPLQLLAAGISFADPVSGRTRRFESTRRLHFQEE